MTSGRRALWVARFESGVPNGPMREGRDDGSRRFEGAFAGGQRSGTWTSWYRGGGKAGEGHYENGRPAGRWTVWSKTGVVARTRQDSGEWKESGLDAGARAGSEAGAPPELPLDYYRNLGGAMTVVEAHSLDEGPPEYVPPLTAPSPAAQDLYYPWGKLHGVWFDEFRIELQLQAEELD